MISLTLTTGEYLSLMSALAIARDNPDAPYSCDYKLPRENEPGKSFHYLRLKLEGEGRHHHSRMHRYGIEGSIKTLRAALASGDYDTAREAAREAVRHARTRRNCIPGPKDKCYLKEDWS
jgi:hypothetical protein